MSLQIKSKPLVLTDEQVRELVKLRLCEAARLIGTSSTVLCDYAKRHGIKFRKRYEDKTRICRVCKRELGIEQFRIRTDGSSTASRRNFCLECEKEVHRPVARRNYMPHPTPNKKRKTRCPMCGEVVVKSQWRIARTKYLSVYCSRVCANKAQAKILQQAGIHSDKQSSKYKGVYFRRDNYKKPWTAACKKKYLGLFAWEVDAAHAYDIAAREMHGGNCYVNFKTEREYAIARGDESLCKDRTLTGIQKTILNHAAANRKT